MNPSGREDTTLRFDEIPSTLKAYAKFLRPRPGIEEGEALPPLRAESSAIPLDREQVQAYREVCSIPDPGDYTLPMLYPHVLAAPLHAHVMAHPDFPLQAAGLIHIANTVTQHRPLRVYEPLSFEVELRGARPARKGHEFDLLTRAFADGELVWEGVTTVLSPVKGKGSGSKKNEKGSGEPGPEPGPVERSVTLEVPSDQGRRYASVSGDYNPIHMHELSAKLFGFKRAIAHGMWTLARVTGEVADEMPQTPRHLTVRFKRPVYLPSTVLLTERRDGELLDIDVTDARGEVPHLDVEIGPLEAFEAPERGAAEEE